MQLAYTEYLTNGSRGKRTISHAAHVLSLCQRQYTVTSSARRKRGRKLLTQSNFLPQHIEVRTFHSALGDLCHLYVEHISATSQAPHRTINRITEGTQLLVPPDNDEHYHLTRRGELLKRLRNCAATCWSPRFPMRASRILAGSELMFGSVVSYSLKPCVPKRYAIT